MDVPANLARMWFLVRDAEECLGAIVGGGLPNVFDADPNQPMVAIVTFAAGEVLSQPGPVLGWDSDTIAHRCRSLDEATAWLSVFHARLAGEGWREVDMPPVTAAGLFAGL